MEPARYQLCKPDINAVRANPILVTKPLHGLDYSTIIHKLLVWCPHNIGWPNNKEYTIESLAFHSIVKKQNSPAKRMGEGTRTMIL